MVIPLISTVNPPVTRRLREAVAASGTNAIVSGFINSNAMIAEVLHIRLAEAGLARADRVRLFSIVTAADGGLIATVGGDGAPHTSALWFVWDGEALWLNTLVRSQRWTNLQRDPRVSVLVDAGHDYLELRGVEMIGRVEQVGDAPRTAGSHAALETPERLFGEKYAGGDFVPDGTHAWVRLVPDKIVSWDFRKLASLSR